MADRLISEQAALTEIGRWIGYLDEDMIERIRIGLRKLPAVQPERMKGRLLNEDELRDLRVTLDGLCIYLGCIAQDVVGATHYQHRVNEMLVMLMKEA